MPAKFQLFRAHRPSCEGFRLPNEHYLRGIAAGAVYWLSATSCSTQQRMRWPDSMKKVIFDKAQRGFTQTDTLEYGTHRRICLLNGRFVAVHKTSVDRC